MTKDVRRDNGTKTVSSITGAGKNGQLQIKNYFRSLSNTIYEINSKCIKDLNIRLNTINFQRKTYAEHSLT